ncbi:hypothetical protein AMTRI_Chr04g242510 [Amborella trichopoda]|uniref:Pentacotripeptide-repeat region of PRORP domain-containing protein n=1 Tax=Amborella trichopoda TaxID=13333 RepID=W1PMU8_AMBTC|nr:pentatricopeptide repeat-containing protein At1g02150 [Amborella trichopoda]ERN11342.1 hypothetical protein AMTR_s00024p00251490 [Amborella trichopoda]|eukprot:XP_011625338.2 pentatricopeptide repeat-containing protein At1g02150 [Amborella trichopoda]
MALLQLPCRIGRQPAPLETLGITKGPSNGITGFVGSYYSSFSPKMRTRHPFPCKSITALSVSVSVDGECDKPLPHRPVSSDWESLYRRIQLLGSQSIMSSSVLEEWIREGKPLAKWELRNITRQLRQNSRFKQALEVSDWLIQHGTKYQLRSGDYAIHLDLISKVNGPHHAERYFLQLPKGMKNKLTYSALLNVYVKENMKERAETTMKKMRMLGFLTSALPYNRMMTLYLNTNNLEKIPILLKEMRDSSTLPDANSYTIWITRCGAVSDVEEMDKVYLELKKVSPERANWIVYSTLANMYIKENLIEKAELCLKEVENRIVNNERAPYKYLLSLYAGMGKKAEMYRIWKLYKTSFKNMTNSSYICLISSLVKLGDIEGAESCFEEWESAGLSYDVRVTNILLACYARKGMVKKAELFFVRMRRQGGMPNPNTWEILAEGYLQNGQLGNALAAMEEAVSSGKGVGWKPKLENVHAIFKDFEMQGDVENVEKCMSILRGMNL